jgi:RecB family exonuclease
MTKVFSTSRAVREFYANYKGKSTLLPKAITIAQFESKAIFVKDRTFIEDDKRVLLLKEALDFKKFKKLQFSSEFITFLKHSEYIFRFFDELSSEKVEISQLKEFDMYALYDEHLEALEILRENYISLLDKNGFVDRVNLIGHYEINEEYIRSLGEIELELDGFLSALELEIFEKISKIVPFYIDVQIDKFNKKIVKTFNKLNLDLKEYGFYKINLSEKTSSTCRGLKKSKIEADVALFQVRLSQIGFINSYVQKFVQDGLEPREIVVVLPDESLATFLKEFDRFGNLNFAMGFSLKNSIFYKKIEAIELYMGRKKDEEKKRLERVEVSYDLIEKIEKDWRKKGQNSTAIEIFEEIFDLKDGGKTDEAIKEQIFRFSKFLEMVEPLSMQEIFRLFLNRLKEQSSDDTRGGKVTVMGLLETRGSNFRGVVVPDFSDDFVPRRSNKDLFLNTKIRKDVGLPTREDRESLQKYYYNQLFLKAEKLAICAVSNESVMPSRFLDELGLKYDENLKDDIYNPALFSDFKSSTCRSREIEKISYRLDTQTLSATKLNTLLSCKRKFYYRYIKKLDEPRNVLESSSAEVGLKLHNVLERIFTQDMQNIDENQILTLFKKELLEEKTDELEEFELRSWLVRLKAFVQNEKRRFDEGYRVYAREISLNSTFEGFRIYGKIDRIDKKGDKLYIIDYKSGNTETLLKQKIENMTNFQLEFYYLLASQNGSVDGVYLYDLKEGVLKEEHDIHEKIDKLKSVLKELKEPIETFEMCEKQSVCLYCPYKKLCLRDV